MGQRAAGFTLLELMVVLVILGLGAAVATPAVMRMVESVSRQNQIDQAMLVLQRLPVEAMKQNRTLELAQTPGYQPAIEVFSKAGHGTQWSPETRAALAELRIWLPDSIKYRANGACTGGDTYWEMADGFKVSLTLTAPVCRPEQVS